MSTLLGVVLTATGFSLTGIGVAFATENHASGSGAAHAFISSSPDLAHQPLFDFPSLDQRDLTSYTGPVTYDPIDLAPPGQQNGPVQEPLYPGFHNFHRVLAYNFTRGLFSADNLWPVIIGGGLTALAAPSDQNVSDSLRGSAPTWGDAGRILGGGLVVASSAGAVLAATPFVESEHFKAFSFTMAESLILNNVITFTLKTAVNRTRPDGSANNSFPSGHSSNAFAWATVLSEYYGRRVAVPAYLVATFIALSRVESGKHYLSDVFAGATIGYLSGITAQRGTKHYAAKKNWALVPSFGPHQVALYFYLSP